MADNTYKQIEEFEKDYNKLFDKGAWEPCDYTTMKDLQKLMYYLEVREAMKNGGEYPGSGRRYYDDEKEDAIRKLHKTMDAETNPEFKMAIQEAIHMLEAK